MASSNTVTDIQEAPLARRPDPVLGWRLWRVRGRSLRSWGINSCWDTGENTARCFNGQGGCPRSPGRRCLCGFWGLFSPLAALEMARKERDESTAVLGLIRGWGECAVHTDEGFRAEHASVACLFSDWAWDAAVMPRPGPLGSAIRWRVQRAVGYVPTRPRRNPDRESHLREVAINYGVPLVRLADAARHGVLHEYGATRAMLRDVERWLAFADDTGGRYLAPRTS